MTPKPEPFVEKIPAGGVRHLWPDQIASVEQGAGVVTVTLKSGEAVVVIDEARTTTDAANRVQTFGTFDRLNAALHA